ncbi:MAG: hypothetical protein KA436_07690, partial [Oligoflexales bacterium]|nr:hypothetical protein [Oligoflexales bacterium]
TRGTGTTVGTPETSTTGGTPEMSTTGGTPEMSTTGGTPGTNPVKTVVPPLYYALGSVAVIAGFVLTGFAVKAKFSNNMRVGPAVDFDPIVAPVETFQRERAAENLESKKIAEKTKSDKTKGISRSLGLGIAAGVTIAIGGAFIAGGVGIDRLALTSNNEDIYTDEMSAIQAALQANRQARQRSACLSCPVAYKPSLLSVLSNPKRSFFVGQDDELKTREPSQTAAQVYLPGSKIKFATKGSNFSCFIDQRDVVTCLDDSLNHTIRRLAVPKKLTAYRLAAGKSHVCAIKKSRDSSDRTVTCWGDENAKVVPTNLGSVRAISAFQGHSCAIKEDLSIQCWGGVPPSEEEDPFTCMNDDQSQCNLPGLPNGFKPGVVSTIHVGSNNLCILDINDRAHCWGWQKANPDEAAKWQALKLLPDLGALRSIIVTGKAACGIKKDRNQGLCWDLKVPSTTVDLGDRVRDLSIDGLNIDYLQADQILSKSLLTHSPHINLITVAPGFVCFIDSNKKLQCKRTDAVIPRDRRNDFNSNDPEGNGFNTSYIPNLPTELGDSSKLLKSIAWVSAIVIAPDSLPPYFYPDGQDPFHYPGALLAVTEDHLIRCVTTEPADRFQLPSPYLRCEPAELNTGFSNFTPISPLISAETACVLGTKTTTGGSITQSLYCWSIVDPRCGLRLAMLVPGLVGPQFDLRGTQIYSCNPKSSFTDSVLSASGPTISRDRRSIAPDSFYIVQADGTVVEHQIIWREHGIFRGGTAPDVTAFNPVSHANFKAKQVSVGTFHVCIIKQDNSVACRFKEGRQGSADFVDVPELGEAVKLVSFAFGGSFTAKPRGVFGVESVNGFCSIDKDSTVACVIEDIKEEDIKAEARYGSLVTTSPPSDLGRVRDLAGSLVSGEICALKESYDTQCWTPSFP